MQPFDLAGVALMVNFMQGIGALLRPTEVGSPITPA